jgi:hypothetical protein
MPSVVTLRRRIVPSCCAPPKRITLARFGTTCAVTSDSASPADIVNRVWIDTDIGDGLASALTRRNEI